MPRLLRQPLLLWTLQVRLRPSLHNHQARQKPPLPRETKAPETRRKAEAIRTPIQWCACYGFRCERDVSWHGAVSGELCIFVSLLHGTHLSKYTLHRHIYAEKVKIIPLNGGCGSCCFGILCGDSDALDHSTPLPFYANTRFAETTPNTRRANCMA